MRFFDTLLEYLGVFSAAVKDSKHSNGFIEWTK